MAPLSGSPTLLALSKRYYYYTSSSSISAAAIIAICVIAFLFILATASICYRRRYRHSAVPFTPQPAYTYRGPDGRPINVPMGSLQLTQMGPGGMVPSQYPPAGYPQAGSWPAGSITSQQWNAPVAAGKGSATPAPGTIIADVPPVYSGPGMFHQPQTQTQTQTTDPAPVLAREEGIVR